MDVETSDTSKRRKRNKYPVGKRKRRKVITSGMKRGRKPKVDKVSESFVETFPDTSPTVSESFQIVGDASQTDNLDVNEANAAENSTNGSDSNGREQNAIPNIDPPRFIDTCQVEIEQNNWIRTLLEKFEAENLLEHFMAFVRGVCQETIKPTNISILLAMEYCYMMSLSNTVKMRYRQDTCKFWEAALAIGGSRLIRLFSSDKHFGQVNSGDSSKSKYCPQEGNFNFAVPHEQRLRKSRTKIPNFIPAGIIDEGIKMLDPQKEYIIALDGKQTGKGLKEIGQGDVDLWGFEGPPTLQDTMKQNEKEMDFFSLLSFRLIDESNFNENAMKEVKFALQINSHKIKNLREAKVRHEILRKSFHRKISKFPDQGNRYVLAFAEIDAFIAKSNMLIQKLLAINVNWCEIMARVNRTSYYFRKDEPIKIDEQDNGYVLLNDDFMDLLYGKGFLEQNPQFVKQRSDKWKDLRMQSRLTGSTMHNALGLRNLKSQKEHFDEFVLQNIPQRKEINAAMVHGSKHEVYLTLISFFNKVY